MTKIGPFALTICVAFCLWLGASSLSDYLSNQYRRREARSVTKELPAELAAVEHKVEKDPDNLALRIDAARAIYAEAQKQRSPALVMKAVGHYAFVLRRDPNNREALSEMAALCFEQGILDKAEEYLRRLLSIEPDSTRARTDLALVLVQAGKAEESLGLLDAVIKEHPTLFPPRFALALAYRVLGQSEKALQAAQDALPHAPDETAKQRISKFMSDISQSSEPSLESFIRTHQILGPKVVSIESSGEELKVSLRQFPVEQMPPVARNVFVSKLQKAMLEDKDINSCTLIDSETGKVLLKVSEQ